MGNYKAVLRKPRKNEITSKCNTLFSEAIQNQDYSKAASIIFYNVLILYGAEGIMNILDQANSYIKRKSRRRGL